MAVFFVFSFAPCACIFNYLLPATYLHLVIKKTVSKISH